MCITESLCAGDSVSARLHCSHGIEMLAGSCGVDVCFLVRPHSH